MRFDIGLSTSDGRFLDRTSLSHGDRERSRSRLALSVCDRDPAWMSKVCGSNCGCGIVQHGLESRADGDRRRRPPRKPGVESFGRESSDDPIPSTRLERESTCHFFPVVRESGCRWPPFSNPRRNSFPADRVSSGIEIWIRPRAGFREIPAGRPNAFIGFGVTQQPGTLKVFLTDYSTTTVSESA